MKVKVAGRQVEVRPTLYDRFVNWKDPVKGNERLKARINQALVGGYEGGSRVRRALKNWNPFRGDADADINPDLPVLRERSADLVRNDPIASGILNTLTISTVGTGLKVRAKIDREYLSERIGFTEQQADDFEGNAERLFDNLANSEECDITRQQNFYQSQELLHRSVKDNGDIIVIWRHLKRAGSPFGLKHQFIEADRLCNKDNVQDSQYLRGGVELDAVGAPKSYHILKSHPGAMHYKEQDWDVVPAYGKKTGRKLVSHVYDKLRVGQHRGVPVLAPVTEILKQKTRLSQATLDSAVIQSFFTVFVSSEQAGGLMDDLALGDAPAADEDYELGHGSIVQLDGNSRIDFANPAQPNSNFDPFFGALVRQIGACIGVPYEIIMKWFTSSYTASRAAFQEFYKLIKRDRYGLESDYCNVYYSHSIHEFVANDMLQAPGFFNDFFIRRAFLGAIWVGQPQPQLDPLKETKASVEKINNNLSSYQRESIEANGSNPEDNIMQNARIKKKAAENGLQLSLNLKDNGEGQEPNDQADKDDENT